MIYFSGLFVYHRPDESLLGTFQAYVRIYNGTFWSVAHVITFTYVPLEHRVAWIALKSFLWNGFLSWRLSRLQKADPPPTHTAALLRRYSTENIRD